MTTEFQITTIWLKVGLTHKHTQKNFNSTNMSEGQKLTTVFQTADDTLIIIAKSLLSTITAFTLYNFIIKTNSSAEQTPLTFQRNRMGRRLKKLWFFDI